MIELQRFAFSTSAYIRHSLKKSFKRIAKFGFKGVEILADKPHVWLDSFSPKEIEKLHKQLEKLDLFVSNINANSTTGFWTDAPPETFYEPSLISRSKTLREWRIAYTKKAIRLAKELGAHSVSLTSGRTLSGVPPEKAAKYLEEGLTRLVEEADRLQQPIAIECVPGLYLERTAELAAIVAKICSPLLGASLNLANVEIVNEDSCQAIHALKGRIVNLRLQDIRSRKQYYRIPGEGDLDFRAIFRALNAVGYTGPLTWDIHTHDESPDEACQRTYRYVRTLLLEMALVEKPDGDKKPPEDNNKKGGGKKAKKTVSA